MKLHWQILIAMVLGAAAGALARPLGVATWFTEDLAVVGTIFLRLLQMIVIPLVFASIVTGIAGLAAERSFGKLFGITVLYYVGSSLAAILTGLILVNVIEPGVGANVVLAAMPEGFTPRAATLRDALIELVPRNVLAAAMRGDMLPTIFFAMLFGVFVGRVGASVGATGRSPLQSVFADLFDVMMAMTHGIVKVAPIGIFALVAKTVAETGLDVFVSLGWYFLTVLLALAIHAGLNLMLILRFVAKRSPREFVGAVSPALLMAFSTASSNATLPLTLETVEKRAQVPNRIAGFTLPLGATINMDGTALYECVAVLFIAQVYGIDLTAMQQAIVVLTALSVSIGAAGIPMVGLVMMTTILMAVGLPVEGVGLIIAVDRILDMCRTTVNVFSDMVAAATVDRLSKGETK